MLCVLTTKLVYSIVVRHEAKMRLNFFNNKYLFLCVLCVLRGEKYKVIMQNKPNLLNAQMNVSSVLMGVYENKSGLLTMENQTQTNPISYSNKMNTTFLLTKDYEQITVNNEPIKTNPIKPNL